VQLEKLALKLAKLVKKEVRFLAPQVQLVEKREQL